MPPGVGYGDVAPPSFDASEQFDTSVEKMPVADVPNVITTSDQQLPASGRESLEQRGFFQPQGDPYMYRMNDDGTVTYYHPQRGEAGSVSLKRIKDENPGWIRQVLSGEANTASSMGEQQATKGQPADVETAQKEVQKDAPVQAVRPDTRPSTGGQEASQTASATPSGIQPSPDAESNLSAEQENQAAQMLGELNEMASTAAQNEIVQGLSRFFTADVAPGARKIGGGPGMIKNLDTTSPIGAFRSLYKVYNVAKNQGFRRAAKAAFGLDADRSVGRRAPPSTRVRPRGQANATQRTDDGFVQGASAPSRASSPDNLAPQRAVGEGTQTRAVADGTQARAIPEGQPPRGRPQRAAGQLPEGASGPRQLPPSRQGQVGQTREGFRGLGEQASPRQAEALRKLQRSQQASASGPPIPASGTVANRIANAQNAVAVHKGGGYYRIVDGNGNVVADGIRLNSLPQEQLNKLPIMGRQAPEGVGVVQRPNAPSTEVPSSVVQGRNVPSNRQGVPTTSGRAQP